MSSKIYSCHYRSVGKVGLIFALLLIILGVLSMPASATPPETLDIVMDVQIGGAQGTWSASGVVNSSGDGDFNPRVTGWFDPETGQYRTVHDYLTLNEYDDLGSITGSITLDVHGHAATVTHVTPEGVVETHEGFAFNWTILEATGAYEMLHGQGNGYGWPDFSTFRFAVFLSGQAHFDPQ